MPRSPMFCRATGSLEWPPRMVLDVAEAERQENASVSAAQVAWAAQPIAGRLAVLRAARLRMSHMTSAFCDAISPDLARTSADTRIAEVLPLLAACEFLEREAAKILATRKLGRRGLPLWLTGINSSVERVALGQILVIGPANYPLFLPGVQTLQALAAGNSVIWKPGRGGKAVADLFALAMFQSGLTRELLTVTEESVQAGTDALAGLVNGIAPAKVFFTGSATAGRAVMRRLAETLTPCVMELSGCDAVVVLPSADLSRVVQAVTFGMRLNGSATCMAPRRLLLVGFSFDRREELVMNLLTAFKEVPEVRLSEATARQLDGLLEDADLRGATIHGAREDLQGPLLVTGVRPEMSLAQADVFVPVISMIDVADGRSLVAAEQVCPYGLTIPIFGDEGEARALGAQMAVGTILINDLIVPTVDPRVPFGGRRQSGFGATRGAEGLLEMTAAKTVLVRKNDSTRHYETTGSQHEGLFDGIILAGHSPTWRQRWRGLKQIVTSARNLKRKD